ncbi:MAG: hypothetical protein E7044_01125 [Lentisphaerae bacterium]|nr:hypothetical protein [Lentisphaerota bacterium]
MHHFKISLPLLVNLLLGLLVILLVITICRNPRTLRKKQFLDRQVPEKLNIQELVLNFEKDTRNLNPVQQKILRKCMELLCCTEKSLRIKHCKSERNTRFPTVDYRLQQLNDLERRVTGDIEILQKKIIKQDIAAWISALEIIYAMQKLSSQEKERDLVMLGQQLIKTYLTNLADNRDFHNGMYIKLWEGWDQRKWSPDIIPYAPPATLKSPTDYNDPFTPLNISFPNSNNKKFTVVYHGYICIPISGEYKFFVNHPSPLLRHQSGAFALYIDNTLRLKMPAMCYDDSRNISKKSFRINLKPGFHSFILFNEINTRLPLTSHVKLEIEFPYIKNWHYVENKVLYAKISKKVDTTSPVPLNKVIPAISDVPCPEIKSSMPTPDIPSPKRNSESLNRIELKKRFDKIMDELPIKFELQPITVSPYTFSLEIQGYGLSMRAKPFFGTNRRRLPGFLTDTINNLTVTYEVNKQRGTIKLVQYLQKPRNRRSPYTCPIMRESIIKSKFGKYIVDEKNNQIEKLYGQIFTTFASNKKIAQRLDELEKNIANYNIARYTVSVTLVSYNEEHNLVSKNGNKANFEIVSTLRTDIKIFDKIKKKDKYFSHDLIIKFPGTITCTPQNKIHVDTKWNSRADVFKNSADQLMLHLLADLQTAHL